VSLLKTVVGDALFGLRTFARKPGFTAVAVLALALGIAVNTAMFSVVYATLLAPLPYPHPDELVTLAPVTSQGGRSVLRPPDFLGLQRHTRSFQALHAWWGRDVSFGVGDTAEALSAEVVTPGYLSMMGGGFELGRDFLPEEGAAGRDRVAILSNRFWRHRFGGDPGVIGRAVRVDREIHTIVGVRAATSERVFEQPLSLPLAFTAEQLDPDWFFMVFVTGRLKPGVTLQAASAEATAVWTRMQGGRRNPGGLDRIQSEALQTSFLARERIRALWLLMAAVGCVLLIACANVAHLLFARGETRRREVALRASLGASRGRLFAQLFTENASLAVIGGLAGTALAFWLVRVAAAVVPHFGVPPAALRLSLPVLAFTALATVLSPLAFGCLPAWKALRSDPIDGLKDGGYAAIGMRRSSWRRALVAGEFAIALTLLAGGGVVVHHLANMMRVDLGLRADHVLTFRLPGPAGGPKTADVLDAFYRDVVGSVQALPGVASVGVSSWLPLQGAGFARSFEVVGHPRSGHQGTNFNMVTPGYFAAYGIGIERGRFLTEEDRAGAPLVAVVNAEFARRYLGGLDPLQQRLAIQEQGVPGKTPAVPSREWQIVGVSRDVLHGGPRGAPQPEIDVAFAQSPWPETTVAVRTLGTPEGHQRSVARALRSVEPDLVMRDVKTMEERVHERIASERFNGALFGTFGALALVLAALGIYAVTSFAVAQRTREIGLRMALGADRGRVLWAVVREGMRTVLGGAVIGSFGAYAATRAMGGLVPGLRVGAPFPLMAVTALLLLAAFVACVIPARRAARVDPLVALRED
jgi:putative ABC transport system permease protein